MTPRLSFLGAARTVTLMRKLRITMALSPTKLVTDDLSKNAPSLQGIGNADVA
jgi:hypothetical protein